MIAIQPTYYLQQLKKDSYKSCYLAFLRISICLWLLAQVFINWPYFDMIYGNSGFIEFKINFLNRLPGGFEFVRAHYMKFIAAYIVVLILNILGIGRWATALLLYLMVYTLQKMNTVFINGGDVMARVALFYLVFANSYQYFVLFPQKPVSEERKKLQNLLSNLAALSIMLQLCLAYFSTGIAKAFDPMWQRGEATYYALQLERFTGTPLNQYIVQHKWLNYFSNYATIIIELGFPILVWVKKLRPYCLIAGAILHLCIYIFLMIYGFQIAFLLIYGLFLPNAFWEKINPLPLKGRKGIGFNIKAIIIV